MCSRSQWSQKSFLLFLRAITIDVIAAKGIMSGHGDPNRAINTREFFDDGRVFDVTHSRPAILFREQHAKESEVSQFWLQLNRKMLGFIPLHHVWRDL